MRDFIRDFWDIITFVVLLTLAMLFWIIGVWTHSPEAGYTGLIFFLPAFFMIFFMMGKRVL